MRLISIVAKIPQKTHSQTKGKAVLTLYRYALVVAGASTSGKLSG